jgi:hypothetical protein
VLFCFLLTTIVVTFPLVFRLTSGAPYGGDALQFIWNGWWFAKAAADPSLSIWFTPYQYAPHGASLFLHDLSPLNAWGQAWLRNFVGDFGAYNILLTNGLKMIDLDDIDQVIFSLKAVSPDIYREYTGASNKKALENLAKIYHYQPPRKLHVRHHSDCHPFLLRTTGKVCQRPTRSSPGVRTETS